MDPDETLKQLRAAIEERQPGRTNRAREYTNTELLELFNALDKWLSSGGFLPKAWNP